MKFALLTAASVLTLSAAMPLYAHAQSETAPAQGAEAGQAEGAGDTMQDTLQKTREGAEGAANALSEAAQEAYYDLSEALSGDNDQFVQAGPTVNVSLARTARGLIGEDATDAEGNAVAAVEDIILDQDGKAQLVVLRDGGLFGMGGKLVALDYASIIGQGEDGDVLIPVTEEIVDQSAEFSYEAGQTGQNARVMPAGGVSLARLLDGSVLGPQGTEAASIDNVTLKDGSAEYVVISFDETLGVGGEKAVMNFDDLQVTPAEGGDVNLTLDQEQATSLENFKMKVEEKKS